MTPRNLLILMSDEHNPKVLGSAGDGTVQTPHLDALAAAGTRFTAAYTTCPICVPARASFATGKYVHQVGFWDNADAYDGSIPSWHHHLRAQGHDVVSIGKLHFRGAPGDDHGFSEELLPMHIVDAVGDVKGLVRDDIPVRKGGDKIAKLAGPGESQYTLYDREIAARAQVWLHEAARRERARPWVLFVSFVSPHFPLIAPPEWYYPYAQRGLPVPKQYDRAERPQHPFLADYERVVDYDRHFRSPADVQRALAGYYGLVSLVDENVGKVLRALERCRTRRRHTCAVHERPRRQPGCARCTSPALPDMAVVVDHPLVVGKERMLRALRAVVLLGRRQFAPRVFANTTRAARSAGNAATRTGPEQHPRTRVLAARGLVQPQLRACRDLAVVERVLRFAGPRRASRSCRRPCAPGYRRGRVPSRRRRRRRCASAAVPR